MGLFDRFRIPSVDAETARALVRDGAVLVDVREQAEWNAGHAPQAVHVPAARLADAGKRLPRGKRVVVICRSGNRSAQATRLLADQGFDAVNLAGGMHAWSRAGGQVVDRKGRPGVVA